MKSYPYTIRFVSDWHVGTGTGVQGIVDAVIDRDDDELPFVPGKSLRGIWRASCRRVAAALGDPWSEWVDVVFGTSIAHQASGDIRPGRVSVSPARFSDVDRAALKSNPLLVDALTSLRPSLAIEPESGVTRRHSFRITEVAAGGLEFRGVLALDDDGWSDEITDIASALMWAGARTIERLGGGRRRGLGRCQVEMVISNDEETRWLELLREKPDKPPSTRMGTTPTPVISNRDASSGWRTFELVIDALQPLVVEDHTQGNVVLSLDRVPGSQLLGPVVSALPGGWKQLYSEVAAGRIRVLDAVPWFHGERGRAVPLSFHREKDGDGDELKVANTLSGELTLERPKQLRAGYVLSGPRLLVASRQERTHNTIVEETQRPESDVGGVYSYQAIVAGTRLASRLIVAEELASKWGNGWIDAVAASLGNLKLGMATDDYGTARLDHLVEMDPPQQKDRVTESTLWALSPILLRDAALRATNDLSDLSEEVRRRLIEAGADSSVEVRADGRAWLRPTRRGGWIRSWRLPRPTLAGIAAGTCVRLTFSSAVQPEQLDWVEHAGLGERTAEGFGEVSFGDQLVEKWKDGTVPRVSSAESRQVGPRDVEDDRDGEVSSGLTGLRQVALERWAERAVVDLAGDPSRRRKAIGLCGGGNPSRTQLGLLRATAGRLTAEPEALESWVKWVSSKADRAEKWWGKSKNRPKKPPESFVKLIEPHTRHVWEMLGGKHAERFSEEERTIAWARVVSMLIDRCVASELRRREGDES